jgi:hypothetical protein
VAGGICEIWEFAAEGGVWQGAEQAKCIGVSGRFVSKKSSAKDFYLCGGGAGGAAVVHRNQKFFGVAFFLKSDRLLYKKTAPRMDLGRRFFGRGWLYSAMTLSRSMKWIALMSESPSRA